jgi:hypothetical protein
VNGGGGADEIAAFDSYNVAAGASVAVAVNGGDGADQVGIIIHFDVAAGASLYAGVDGGSGADSVGIVIEGSTVAAGASASIGVDSGSGNDVVRGGFSFDPESHGVIAIIFQGGSGDDDLTLDISGIGDPNILNARLDGGAGFDIAHVTRNVDVVNCEEVFFL